MKRLWTRLLIALHVWRDWEHDPQYTPPAFLPVLPHIYDPDYEGKTLTFCAACGGGSKHAIHAVDVSSVIEYRIPGSKLHLKPYIEREH